jgi:polyferredoxin
MSQFLIRNRAIVHAFFAAAVYALVSYFEISLIQLLLGSIILGTIFGKVFCQWLCPVGVLMGLFTKKTMNDEQRMMYKHKKLGCPIAWITGFLNKHSLFKIKVNPDTCIACGTCDESCYISKVDDNFSLYDPKKDNSNDHYNCGKCMTCIEQCPTDSLHYSAK